MNVCTFLGHREVWEDIEERLTEALIHLINNENVSRFYVGNHGAFDGIVLSKLRELKKQFPDIEYHVVLAYLPSKEHSDKHRDFETIYPEGIENTPPRYAIIKRNQWMVDKSDFVVTYIRHPIGGAANAREYAKRKKKRLIDISKICD